LCLQFALFNANTAAGDKIYKAGLKLRSHLFQPALVDLSFIGGVFAADGGVSCSAERDLVRLMVHIKSTQNPEVHFTFVGPTQDSQREYWSGSASAHAVKSYIAPLIVLKKIALTHMQTAFGEGGQNSKA
jgi:hypothetical protein